MDDVVPLGEPLAIELANTIVGTGDDARDLLADDDGVRAWVIALAHELPARAAAAPPDADVLRGLRAAAQELFSAVLNDRTPAPVAVRLVNERSRAAPERLALRWAGARPPTLDRDVDGPVAAAVLATIARSVITLLGTAARDRLRRCEAPGCVRLFVASNPRRRWCSPATCGNRVRVARHYARHRA